MAFFLKQYIHAVQARGWWLLAALIPLAFYLASSGARPDRFTIERELSISADAPISLSPKPGDLTEISDIISNPDAFLLNRFALSTLEKTLQEDIRLNSTLFNSPRALKILCAESMSISIPDKDLFRIVFHGENRELGEAMVEFYSHRLLYQADAGLNLTRARAPNKLRAHGMAGDMEVTGHRALWRSERFFPASRIVAVSLLVILVIIGVVDRFDASLKSERQTARYLNVPVLGSLPNLKGVSAAIKSKG